MGDVMRTASINVEKIDKSRLVQGKYLNLVWWEKQEEDQYGNHGMITQGVSKEDRQSGIKGAILGNVKRWGEYNSSGGGSNNAPRSKAQSGQFDEEPDDLPF